MTGVFAYLTVCSIRNSVRARFRRLKQPRYLVIAVGFVLYVGSLIAGQRPAGALALIAVDGLRAGMIASAVATLLLATAWIFPVAAALRFTNAEVQFLFTAPVPRRELITYKVWRLLLGAAASGLFITVLAGPRHLAPAMVFALKSAIVMSVFTLYNATVALYRTGAREQGDSPSRRARTLAASVLLTPVVGAGLVFVAFSSGSALPAALTIGMVLIVAIAVSIVRSDSAFEEAASVAADKMSRAVATGHFFKPRLSRSRSTPFRLAARGPAETAFLWKNWLLVGRMSRQAMLAPAIGLVSMIAVFIGASGGEFKSEVVGEISVFFVALGVMLGPAMIRIDLRQDLGHLALIKTWPVRGAAVIRGQVLAPAILLSVIAAAAVGVGSAFAPALFLVDQPHAAARAMFAVSAVLVVTTMIVAQLVIHNAIAVTFPAWLDLRAAAAGAAMEVNVRMMIVMYGAILIFAFVLVVPAGAAFAASYLGGGLLPATIFAALLAIESLAASEVVGRILDRTDLQDVVVTE